MRNLHSLLFPKTSKTYEIDSILRQQLLWLLMLRIVLYTLLMGITYFLGEFKFGIIVLPRSALILLLLLIYSISIVSALVITRQKINLQRFGFIQSIFDTIFASLLIYFTGISNSIYTSLFFFPIISGGLILPRKGGLIAAAASTILFGALLFLEYTGLVPDYFIIFDYRPMQNELELFNLFAVKGLTFFLAALLSPMFGFRLTSTEEVLSDTIHSFDKLSHLYKTIFDNISTGIITANDSGIITSANAAAQAITGYTLNDLLGNQLNRYFPSLELHNKSIRQSMDFVKKDGTETRIGYSITSLPKPDHEGSPEDNLPKYEEERTLVTLQDISEIEKMERKLRQGEKMAAIGMMSAGIAHDFRNPLTAISGSAQVLANEFRANNSEDKSENLALTGIIMRESNRLISTISDFLELARPDIASRQWFSLTNCISEVLQVCRANPEWPSSSRIDIDIDPRMDIWADEKQFFTVMNHLIQNGMAFCPEGHEVIHIQAKELTLEEDKEVLVVSVEDNGPGIEEELQEKIFEPFYTNRANGTGLGLAIVRQIIEGHRGTIEVSSSSLGGAKFTIVLPYL
jgi:two-component system sensor histidine kinase PilS (NtrC family)